LVSLRRVRSLMPALYPMMSAPEDFRPGQCVRKFVSENAMTPYEGVVTHIAPKAVKVWVQWPTEHASESPETLIKVNPLIQGMPTALMDMGYDSYEKTRSEKLFGKSPLKPRPLKPGQKMVIRVAHTFANNIIGGLVDDICASKDSGLSDIKAYDQAYRKYGHMCPDHVIRASVEKIYS